jgi:hypothetical protein
MATKRLLPSAKSKRISSLGDTTVSIFTGAAFTNEVAAPNTIDREVAIRNTSRAQFVIIFCTPCDCGTKGGAVAPNLILFQFQSDKRFHIYLSGLADDAIEEEHTGTYRINFVVAGQN